MLANMLATSAAIEDPVAGRPAYLADISSTSLSLCRCVLQALVVRRESSRADRGDRRMQHHQLEVRHSADYGPDSDRPPPPPSYKRATRESFLI